MTNTTTPPFVWVQDQARAWRLVAAIREHDGLLFDRVVAEARTEGDDAVDKLLSALAKNLLVRLRIEIGMKAVDDLIDAELRACDSEPMQEPPNFGGIE